MLRASVFSITRPIVGGEKQVSFIDRDAAVAVIENLLQALEAPEAQRAVCLDYAKALAELRLQQWGVQRQPSARGVV